MRALGWIALVLGLAAVGVSIYGIVETYPNLKSFGEMVDAGKSRIGELDRALLADYTKSVNLQHFISWGAGGLAIILGVVAFAKEKAKIGLVAAFLGLLGAALTLMTKA